MSFASISTAAMPTSKDFAGIRIRLDQEKKEARSSFVSSHDCSSSCRHVTSCHMQVRQMRGMESQLKWDMLREERNQTEEERREEATHMKMTMDDPFPLTFCAFCFRYWTPVIRRLAPGRGQKNHGVERSRSQRNDTCLEQLGA